VDFSGSDVTEGEKRWSERGVKLLQLFLGLFPASNYFVKDDPDRLHLTILSLLTVASQTAFKLFCIDFVVLDVDPEVSMAEV